MTSDCRCWCGLASQDKKEDSDWGAEIILHNPSAGSIGALSEYFCLLNYCMLASFVISDTKPGAVVRLTGNAPASNAG
jgi:hypothetical protein